MIPPFCPTCPTCPTVPPLGRWDTWDTLGHFYFLQILPTFDLLIFN